MTEETSFKDQITDTNKNKNSIDCQFCNSSILKPLTANYIKEDFSLPLSHQKSKTTIENVESEILSDFWIVSDMFTFENIGFSNTVDNTKYLICADCDCGPVGYHNITTKNCYIALKRVKHVST